MAKRGRPPKLTEKQVEAIRKRYAEEKGATIKKIAAAYGVSESVVQRAVHGDLVTREVRGGRTMIQRRRLPFYGEFINRRRSARRHGIEWELDYDYVVILLREINIREGDRWALRRISSEDGFLPGNVWIEIEFDCVEQFPGRPLSQFDPLLAMLRAAYGMPRPAPHQASREGFGWHPWTFHTPMPVLLSTGFNADL